MFDFKIGLISALSLSLLGGATISADVAIANSPCQEPTQYEPVSEQLRTVKLQSLNVEVDIPDNYRAMLNQDGSVSILHPKDYAHIQCVIRGQARGRGLDSQNISRIQRDPQMSLKDQAIWSVGHSIDASGNKTPIGQAIEFQKDSHSGYIATGPFGSIATFLGQSSGDNRLLKATAATSEEIKDFLGRIRPLQ